MAYRILILNGPNLGMLGVRQPEIYGSTGMEAVGPLVERMLAGAADEVELDYFQSNSEGGLIDRIEDAWRDGMDGLVFNAGAYTHTSLAIADALAWIEIPCVEVHLSNIWARTDQPLRRQSPMGANCIGVIAGFGIVSYALAVQALHQHLTSD